MSRVGIDFVQCAADADRPIVTTAIKLAEDIDKTIIIVAEDTDIIVLLTEKIVRVLIAQIPINILKMKMKK